MMHPEKASGPDGMTAIFFQHSWHIIRKDVVEMVNNFLVTRDLDPRLNITNICMIPKIEQPTRMTELRLISLCNVGYKIISKVLCQRLKEYEVVSGQQINFQKSSIQFGHKIEDSSCQELRDILGIQNLGGMGSYLGLPKVLEDLRYKCLVPYKID